MLCACTASAQPVKNSPQQVQQAARPSVLRFFKSNVWGTKTVELTNRSDEPADVVTGGYFEGVPLTRYARRVTIPPGSSRIATFPMMPTVAEDRDLQWHPFLYAADEDGSMLRASQDYMVDSESLPRGPQSLAAVILDRYSSDDDTIDALLEMTAVCQISLGHTRRLVELDASEVPSEPHGLDVVDRIVLGSNQIADDPARLQCLRSWVEQGGQLWIRLDYVSADTVNQLLGDTFSWDVAGRTGLTDFQIENTAYGSLIPEMLHFEYPVDSVRVVTSGVRIVHEVDGWPATFTTTIGRGTIVFTTLGNRAWLRDRTSEDPAVQPEYFSEFVARPTLVEVVNAWTTAPASPPLEPEALQPMLTDQIGYRIPGRQTILGVLITFCAALVCSGWWLNRMQRRDVAHRQDKHSARTGRRLELLAVIGPALAVLAALPIMGLGQASRSAVPSSINSVEFVQIAPTRSSARSAGTVAVFSRNSDTADFSATQGRILQPRQERLAGTIQQMTQMDFGHHTWENLNVNAGLQFFASSKTQPLAQPVSAVVTFGPDGASGRLNGGPYEDPQDVIIAGRSPNVLALTLDDRQFFEGSSLTLAPGVYTSGALLTDLQAHRQRVYESLLSTTDNSRYPSSPTLLAWMKSQADDIRWPGNFTTNEQCLVAIPVDYEPTPPDTDVLIPSTFLPAHAVPTSDGNLSSAYNNRTRQWQEALQPAQILLQFTIPASARPMVLNRLDLQLKLLAPARRVRVSVGSHDKPVAAATVDDGAGLYQFELTDPDQLRLDADGNFYVLLDVLASDDGTTGARSNKAWKVDYLQMEAYGRTTTSDTEDLSQEKATQE